MLIRRSDRMGEMFIEELKDIRNVEIDRTKPINERILSLYIQISNPYHFKYKGITVTVEYVGSVSIEDIILS
jgi:hypothetical protein